MIKCIAAWQFWTTSTDLYKTKVGHKIWGTVFRVVPPWFHTVLTTFCSTIQNYCRLWSFALAACTVDALLGTNFLSFFRGRGLSSFTGGTLESARAICIENHVRREGGQFSFCSPSSFICLGTCLATVRANGLLPVGTCVLMHSAPPVSTNVSPFFCTSWC